MLARSLQHVGIDQDGQHAQRFVRLNKSHSTHVGGQVVDIARAFRGPFAVFLQV
jgi:hypothetical protein